MTRVKSVPYKPVFSRRSRGDDHGYDRTAERKEHVLLRIPFVALGTQIGRAESGTDDHRDRAFHGLVKAVERQLRATVTK